MPLLLLLLPSIHNSGAGHRVRSIFFFFSMFHSLSFLSTGRSRLDLIKLWWWRNIVKKNITHTHTHTVARDHLFFYFLLLFCFFSAASFRYACVVLWCWNVVISFITPAIRNVTNIRPTEENVKWEKRWWIISSFAAALRHKSLPSIVRLIDTGESKGRRDSV